MIQTTQAKLIWKSIPQPVRLKLLNNVYCVECKQMTGVGNIKMTVKGGDLIINGSCTSCGGNVARLIEVTPDARKKLKAPTTPPAMGNHNPDISGLVSFRSDTKAADLINSVGKLKMNSFGQWNPNDEFQDSKEVGKLSHPYDKILAIGNRPAWEMENILPGFDLDSFDCPIGEGIDLMNAGDWDGAVKHMKGLLKMDARCLDAYAHLGNWYFEQDEPKDHNTAKNYYKTGVAIGMKSMGSKVNDVFPWGLIDNRPFMRCLHGLGLCFYRQKMPNEALLIFSKMIWLNPSDNQGARFLVKALIEGISWESFQEQESDQVRH